MPAFRVLDGRFAVCRLSPGSEAAWVPQHGFLSITRAVEELSVVCQEAAVPDGVRAERGWRAIQLEGPFDFSLTGVLASMLNPLAEARVPIFALSTFDTDYILIPEEHFPRALAALETAGHRQTA